MFVASIEGLPQCLAKLAETRRAKGEGVARGLKKAGLMLQRWSQAVAPVDKGIMYGSAFTRASGDGFNTEVQVGYSAAYAIYVHENLDAAHGSAYNEKYAEQIARGDKGFHSRGANQQAKFLEQPAREHAQEIKDIIKEEARR